jgi:hypothetical protein
MCYFILPLTSIKFIICSKFLLPDYKGKRLRYLTQVSEFRGSDTVCDWLYMASIYRSITCRTEKEYVRKERKLIYQSLYSITADESSLWILSGCSTCMHTHTTIVPPSVSDVDRYVTIRKLLDSIFNILPIYYAAGNFKHIYTGLSLL